MFCLNGDFHLYWSVNYWGKDKHAVHIVHAQSKNVLGPYIEPDKKTWMDNRIDPKVFKDDDGQLYMYMVRFTDGNTIWGRKMKNPAEFAGEPVCLFASLPDTWETMDNRVAEGPWVMKYRDRYYLMYNANHTSTEWGNYQLGVAEADSPLSFQNGNKYSYPVVIKFYWKRIMWIFYDMASLMSHCLIIQKIILESVGCFRYIRLPIGRKENVDSHLKR